MDVMKTVAVKVVLKVVQSFINIFLDNFKKKFADFHKFYVNIIFVF